MNYELSNCVFVLWVKKFHFKLSDNIAVTYGEKVEFGNFKNV